MIRNKRNHFYELPANIKFQIGKAVEDYLNYFTKKFPKLMIFLIHFAEDNEMDIMSLKIY